MLSRRARRRSISWRIASRSAASDSTRATESRRARLAALSAMAAGAVTGATTGGFAGVGCRDSARGVTARAGGRWAAVEGKSIMEEFFSKLRDASDLAALAREYDAKITPLLNLK